MDVFRVKATRLLSAAGREGPGRERACQCLVVGKQQRPGPGPGIKTTVQPYEEISLLYWNISVCSRFHL